MHRPEWCCRDECGSHWASARRGQRTHRLARRRSCREDVVHDDHRPAALRPPSTNPKRTAQIFRTIGRVETGLVDRRSRVRERLLDGCIDTNGTEQPFGQAREFVDHISPAGTSAAARCRYGHQHKGRSFDSELSHRGGEQVGQVPGKAEAALFLPGDERCPQHPCVNSPGDRAHRARLSKCSRCRLRPGNAWIGPDRDPASPTQSQCRTSAPRAARPKQQIGRRDRKVAHPSSIPMRRALRRAQFRRCGCQRPEVSPVTFADFTTCHVPCGGRYQTRCLASVA